MTKVHLSYNISTICVDLCQTLFAPGLANRDKLTFGGGSAIAVVFLSSFVYIESTRIHLVTESDVYSFMS